MSKLTLFLDSLDTLLKKVTYLDFVVKNSENTEVFFFQVCYMNYELAYRPLIRAYRVEKFSEINKRTGTLIRDSRVQGDPLIRG